MDNKITVVGNYSWDFYEKALVEGFRKQNITTVEYLIESKSIKNRLLNSKLLKEINNKFIEEILKQKPDVIFFYRTNEIYPKTLKIIKKELPEIKLILFHNDNPFYGLKHRIKYNLYLKCIKEVDLVYCYRPSNILDVKKYGAKKSKLLYPYYYSKNDLVKHIDFSKKKYDVVFIGHYEKNRAISINHLISRGIDVKVFGELKAWEESKNKFNWPNHILHPPVYNKDYTDTLNNSKIALCFLSRINNDVYTRRNFEIPASGTLALSEYTDELTKLFMDNKEILLFKDDTELYHKVQNVLKTKNQLKEMTLAGYNKVISAGNSENDRALQIINDISFI